MHYTLLHALIKGLFSLPSYQMSRRSVFLSTKHIDWLFSLSFEKFYSAHQTAEDYMRNFFSHQKKVNIICTLYVLFVDEIGQVPAELFPLLVLL